MQEYYATVNTQVTLPFEPLAATWPPYTKSSPLTDKVVLTRPGQGKRRQETGGGEAGSVSRGCLPARSAHTFPRFPMGKPMKLYLLLDTASVNYEFIIGQLHLLHIIEKTFHHLYYATSHVVTFTSFTLKIKDGASCDRVSTWPFR